MVEDFHTICITIKQFRHAAIAIFVRTYTNTQIHEVLLIVHRNALPISESH